MLLSQIDISCSSAETYNNSRQLFTASYESSDENMAISDVEEILEGFELEESTSFEKNEESDIEDENIAISDEEELGESTSFGKNQYFESEEEVNPSESFYKNQKLHPSLQCNKLEALQMILAFFLRHNLTFAALEDLLILVNNLLSQKSLPESKYFFFKLFSKNFSPSNVFFCKNNKCGAELVIDNSNLDTICNFCQTKNHCDIKKFDNYFISLPIEEQLKEVIKSKLYSFIKEPVRTETINDITDGNIYKMLPGKNDPNGKLRHKVTLTLNTDGVEVFKSSKKSLWPIQATINELNVIERFRTKNILLLGLYYHNNHPNMQLFLKKLVLDLIKLKDTGIEILADNNKYYFDVTLICGTFDGPAKAAVQNITQHNGYFSCHYCEQRGDSVVVNSAGTLQVRYPYKQEMIERTNDEAISNMKAASDGNSVKGRNYQN